MLDPVDVLDQPHPGRLAYVSRIAIEELEVPGNGPDKAAIPLHEAIPCPGVAFGGHAQQHGRIEVRDSRTIGRRALDGRILKTLL
jgi:hypothetical protein